MEVDKQGEVSTYSQPRDYADHKTSPRTLHFSEMWPAASKNQFSV